MAPSPERRREIADFFAAHDRDLREAVAYRVQRLPAAAIEDACQIAWEKLSRRHDVDLRTTGRAWLVTVALHEALRHCRRERRETPAGTFNTPYGDSMSLVNWASPLPTIASSRTKSPTGSSTPDGSRICG